MAKEKKLPWMKFVADDWLSNTAVLSPESRGAWVDLLCWMHLNGRTGVFTGTTETLVWICRSTPELITKFLTELEQTEVADVTKGNAKVTEFSGESNAKVTVINRRMNNEYNERNNSKLRKQRYDEKNRSNGKSNATVTVQKTEDRRQKTEDRENIEERKEEKKEETTAPVLKFADILKEDEIWKQTVMMQTRVVNVNQWIDRFDGYLNMQGKTHQTIQDYRSHFVNYLVKVKDTPTTTPVTRGRRQAN